MGNRELTNPHESAPGLNADPNFGLTGEQRAKLPDNVLYWLALEGEPMQRYFESLEAIEAEMKRLTGLDKAAQTAARKAIIGTGGEEHKGLEVERSDEGVRLLLRPAGRKKLVEEIAKVKKSEAGDGGSSAVKRTV